MVFGKLNLAAFKKASIKKLQSKSKGKRPQSLPPASIPTEHMVALRTTHSLCDIKRVEQEMIEAMMDAAHDPKVLNLRSLLSRGVMAEWMEEVLRKGEMTLPEVNTVLSIECGKGEETTSFTTAAITACEGEALELPAQDIEETVASEDVLAEDVSLTPDSLVSIDLSDDVPLLPAAHVLLDVNLTPASALLAPPAVDCSDVSKTIIGVSEDEVKTIAHLPPPLPLLAVPDTSDVSKTFVDVPLDEVDEVKSTAADEFAIETTVQVTQEPEPRLPSIHQVPVPDAEAVPPADSEDKEIVQPVVKAVHGVKVHYSTPVTVQAPVKKPVLASNLLKDLKVDKKLGSGGFGAVYAVTHKKTGVRYALKVMSKTRKDIPEEHHQAIEGHLTRVAVQETFALHRTAGIAGVVDLVASTYDSLNFYHVLPLYEGGDLANEIARCGSFPDVKARFYIAEIVQAVAALHDQGLIHRDLKPGNILLSTNGHAVIADLGLAKAFTTKRCTFELESYERYFPALTEDENDAKGVTKTRCGTPEYMAPELCAGQLYDSKVDVFAMGLILFEMLVGVLPQELPDWDGDLTRVSDQYGISEHAEDFIAEALAELPGDRPTAKELMKFEIFDGCDWDELRDQEVYEGWLPVSDSEESDGNPITFVPGEPIDPAMDFLPFFNFQSPHFSQLPSSAMALPTAVSDHELPAVVAEDSFTADNSIGSLQSIAPVNLDQTSPLDLDVQQEPEPEASLLWDASEVERSPSPCAVSDPPKSSLPSVVSTQDHSQLSMPSSSSNTSLPWAMSIYSDPYTTSTQSPSLPAQGSQLEAPSVPISYSSDNDSRPWALCILGTAQYSSIESTSVTNLPNSVASGASSPSGSPSYCSSEGGLSASATPDLVPTSFNTLVDGDSSCVGPSTSTTRLSSAFVRGEPMDPAMDSLPFFNFKALQFSQPPPSATALPTAASDHELPAVGCEDVITAQKYIEPLQSITLSHVSPSKTPSPDLNAKQEPETEASLLWDAFEVERSPSPRTSSDSRQPSLLSVISAQVPPQPLMPSSSNISPPRVMATYSDPFKTLEHNMSLMDQPKTSTGAEDCQHDTTSVSIGCSPDNNSRPWALPAIDPVRSPNMDSTFNLHLIAADVPICLVSRLAPSSGLSSYCSSIGSGLSPSSEMSDPTPSSFNTLVEDLSGGLPPTTCQSSSHIKLSAISLLGDPSCNASLLAPNDLKDDLTDDQCFFKDELSARPSASASPSVGSPIPPSPEAAISCPLLPGIAPSSSSLTTSSFANYYSTSSAIIHPDEESLDPLPTSLVYALEMLSTLTANAYSISTLYKPISMFSSLKDLASSLWNRVTSCLRLLLW